jgi:alanyl-tRNA synthetase
MKANEIRKKFLEFFRERGHEVVPSSPVIPANDPTLLFTNAGMNQFKDVFTGKEERRYKRATSVQKCMRAGGKHNDLENVGFTARHNTFFEMLGNFSFGDYFKKDAIRYAWDFITKVLNLPQDILYVSVFKDDNEAFDIWHKDIGIAKERIVRLGEKDNFWSMGDTGPCGPCSEIFVDRGPEFGCRGKDCFVGCDCDRYLEFWNLVFMQFDRGADGKMKPLPKPSVDTGMGLERIASILQQGKSNYDTDLFREIIGQTIKLLGKLDDNQQNQVALRVIADHSRAVSFLISDGVIPSNEGRGYVLRRIIRRAVRYGRNLGFNDLFLHKTCHFVTEQMGEAYPELRKSQATIEKYVTNEEAQFRRTLERGILLLEEEMAKLKKGAKLPGEVSFKLYDTYGFPFDLTTVIAKEQGLLTDDEGFEKLMNQQKSQSRQSRQDGSDNDQTAVYIKVQGQLKAANKLPKFVGYSSFMHHSNCTAIIVNKEGKREVVDSYKFDSASNKDILELCFLETPFYPEGGGQIGDSGEVSGSGFRGKVVDCAKPLGDLILVKVKPQSGEIKIGDQLVQNVDAMLRRLTARNHTATHLLHWALRKVLGEHVKQAGSLVNYEMLRFDFAHFNKVTPDEIREIENLINEKIWLDAGVSKEEMAKDAAIQKGAIAFFGEKYGEKVRVVSVGDFSVELCGGTHVDSLAEINLFKITSESSIASGVRRIVALTSQKAFMYLQERSNEVQSLRETLGAVDLADATAKIEKLKATEKELRKQLEEHEKERMASEVDALIKNSQKLGDLPLVTNIVSFDPLGMKKLRALSETMVQKQDEVVVVLGMKDNGSEKCFLTVAVGPKAPKGIKANEIIKELAPMIQGRGGGKPELAQAGGEFGQGLDLAIASAKSVIEKML